VKFTRVLQARFRIQLTVEVGVAQMDCFKLFNSNHAFVEKQTMATETDFKFWRTHAAISAYKQYKQSESRQRVVLFNQNF